MTLHLCLPRAVTSSQQVLVLHPKGSLLIDAGMGKNVDEQMKLLPDIQRASNIKGVPAAAQYCRDQKPRAGDIAPRDMIRLGRLGGLLRLIVGAIAEIAPPNSAAR
jgi:hypothetical protein